MDSALERAKRKFDKTIDDIIEEHTKVLISQHRVYFRKIKKSVLLGDYVRALHLVKLLKEASKDRRSYIAKYQQLKERTIGTRDDEECFDIIDNMLLESESE